MKRKEMILKTASQYLLRNRVVQIRALAVGCISTNFTPVQREGAVMKTLIVSNFPDETTEEDVGNLFREYQVEKVTLRPKKYAVVTFQNEDAAENALKEWREVVWSRHWLRVKPGRW